MWDTVEHMCFRIPNVYITGVPEGKERKQKHIKLKEDNEQI